MNKLIISLMLTLLTFCALGVGMAVGGTLGIVAMLSVVFVGSWLILSLWEWEL